MLVAIAPIGNPGGAALPPLFRRLDPADESGIDGFGGMPPQLD